jgi:hypothetical protein
MSKSISLILAILTSGLILARQAFGADAKTNEWGAVACNAQMSIELKESMKEIKTNTPVHLTINMRGNSTNQVYYFMIYSYPTDFSWIVTSPSGKNLTFKESYPMDALATMMVRLDEIPNWWEDFNLSSVCSFNEVGIYKVIAKKEILSAGGLKKCEVTSNPLNLVVSK